ncbi:MAG: tyrosine-type recombinase/integrase [Saprospiraceae bacterium]
MVPYRLGWRAFVLVDGKRRSKVFRLRSEANRWADQQDTSAGRLTFAAALDRFLKWKLPQLDANNQSHYESSLRVYALPVLGSKQVAEIKRTDLVALVTAIAATGKVETAHRVGQRIRAVLDHCVDSGDLETHAAAGLARILPTKLKAHIPALPPAELPGLLAAIHTYPEPVTRLGLLLLAHTFVRTSELVGARWDEIKGDLWVVPGERMKRGLPHVVPLSAHVLQLLDELRQFTGDSPYWLASGVNPNASISKNTLLFALYRLGYRGRMTGHGFRSVASTVLNESGEWSRDVIERQLAHQETDEVRAAYHRAEYLDQRRTMMDWYSTYLADRAAMTSS